MTGALGTVPVAATEAFPRVASRVLAANVWPAMAAVRSAIVSRRGGFAGIAAEEHAAEEHAGDNEDQGGGQESQAHRATPIR